MICKVCNKVSPPPESEECFEKALEILKTHYVYYRNALRQRDLEIHQIKERNEKLNKALLLLQKNRHPSKRFKSQNSNESWPASDSSQDYRVASELSLTDDEAIGPSNLNVALNSEQLFDTSSLSEAKIDISTTSSEMVQSSRVKESPKRNKQRDTMRYLKGHSNKSLVRSKTEWHTKDRKRPAEKSWTMKFLEPLKTKCSEEEKTGETKKTADKKLCLSLKKTNPSKMKQSHIDFNKTKDTGFREFDTGQDAIDDSLVITKHSKAGRSWTHRSGQNNDSTSSNIKKEMVRKDNTLDDIVFDFSPSKKTDSSQKEDSGKHLNPKKLKFDGEIGEDCVSSLHTNDNLGISTSKTDSSSVVILTPSSEDIIFVEDDTCNIGPEIDTMDLLNSTANFEKLKDYESKCIQKQQQSKDIDPFKKPLSIHPVKINVSTFRRIKQEQTTQDNLLKPKNVNEVDEEKPSSSKSSSHAKSTKHQNPLLSSDEQDTEGDEDFMPKPFIIKQEAENSAILKKLSIKKRFNIDCEDCEKLINFFDERLTDEQIQQHLDKCKRHNNPDVIHQNTPKDFWNPFILSFQADDPRNEVLIDDRFKDNKN